MGLVLNGRHARCDVGGMDIVGETHQGHIVGNTQAALLDGCKCCKGDDIVECQDGIRTVVALQKFRCTVKGYLIVNLVAENQFALNGDMILAQSGDHYEEYMYINGNWDMVGTTGDGGSSGGYILPVATAARLGGVKASAGANQINVTEEGIMTLNQVSTSLLYVPVGDTLILYGGTA